MKAFVFPFVGLLGLAAAAGAAAGPSLMPARRDPVRTDCSCAGRPAAEVEPSGIVLDDDGDGEATLYLVSDSGQIAARRVDSDGAVWSCLYVFCGDRQDPQAKADNDFEGAAIVPGLPRYLWVVSEGTVAERREEGSAADGARLPPRLRPFDLVERRFAGNFRLDGVPVARGSGVESLTFVPESRKKNGVGPAGHFLVSSQHPKKSGADSGAVYRFPLPAPPFAGLAEVALQPELPPFRLLPERAAGAVSSDFYYDPGTCRLYVAYNDDSSAVFVDREQGEARLKPGSQAVAVFALQPGGLAGAQPFAALGEWNLPAGRGVEGVTAWTRGGKTELFVAIDLSGSQNPGPFAAGGAPGEGKIAKKKDLKAFKGPPAPNTVDRYPPTLLIPPAPGGGCPE